MLRGPPSGLGQPIRMVGIAIGVLPSELAGQPVQTRPGRRNSADFSTSICDSRPCESEDRSNGGGRYSGSKEVMETGSSYTPEMLSEVNKKWNSIPVLDR